MLCRDVLEGDAYLWTVLAGVVPKITVNDRTVTNQQWPPGVRTRTAVATMLFCWVSVTGNHVTVQPERKISTTFKKFVTTSRYLLLKFYTEPATLHPRSNNDRANQPYNQFNIQE